MINSPILAVIDPTAEQQPALQRAARIARETGSALELLICDFDSDIDAGRTALVWIEEDEPAKDHLIGIYKEKLERLAEPLRKTGIDASIKVVWDFPLQDAIMREIASCRPWIVFKDTHHHNLLRRTIFSNTDWRLIRKCPVPLYLAKPRELPPHPVVYAAVDPLHEHDKPAELDHAIMEIGQRFAGYLSGELHAVHTYALPELLAATPVGVTVREMERRQRQDEFNKFVAAYSLPSGRAHFVEGLPEVKLPELTHAEHAGLVVIGAVSRRGLDRLIIGSTAERALDRLGCDLLVVKPPRHAEIVEQQAA